jgi:hypothetical protein
MILVMTYSLIYPDAAVIEWKEKREAGEEMDSAENEVPHIYAVPPDMSESDRLEEAMKEGKEGRHFAHMAIPTQKDIERALLERKKRELLNMYALDD